MSYATLLNTYVIWLVRTFVSMLLHKWTFWVALSFIAAGLLLLESTGWVMQPGVSVGRRFLLFGNLLILTQIIVSVLVILRTTYEGVRYGYDEGRLNAIR